jgi:hypothetical protein
MKTLSSQRPRPSLLIRISCCCSVAVNCALVAVENIRPTQPQSGSQRLPAEACLQRRRQRPAQHIAAEPVHHRHQVEEAPPHRHIGDVARPDLIWPVDDQVPQQVRIDRSNSAPFTPPASDVSVRVSMASSVVHQLLSAAAGDRAPGSKSVRETKQADAVN